MPNKIFEESQRFDQPWAWVIIFGTYIPVHIWGIKDIMIEYSKGGDRWTSETFIAAIVGLVLLNFLLVFFFMSKLETRIDSVGIQFRYPPIINSWRKISFKENQSVRVIKYSPWTYGGWGIKYSWNGWAYNVRGNKGIMINKKNGKQILIGTQEMMDAKAAIENQMREERS